MYVCMMYVTTYKYIEEVMQIIVAQTYGLC
jgi:hypothetical protein